MKNWKQRVCACSTGEKKKATQWKLRHNSWSYIQSKQLVTSNKRKERKKRKKRGEGV